MKKILMITHCYPRSDRDSTGVFVKDWEEMIREGGYAVDVLVCEGLAGRLQKWTQVVQALTAVPKYLWLSIRAAGGADLVMGHWLFPGGVLAVLAGLLRRKPVHLVLYGDPFIIETNRFVRWIARMVLNLPERICVHVICTPCLKIIRKIYGGRLALTYPPSRVIP